MPMRFYESVPYTFSSPDLTMVQTSVSMAALDSNHLAHDARPRSNGMVMAPWRPRDRRWLIYQVGNFDFAGRYRSSHERRISDGARNSTPDFAVEIPDDWSAHSYPRLLGQLSYALTEIKPSAKSMLITDPTSDSPILQSSTARGTGPR